MGIKLQISVGKHLFKIKGTHLLTKLTRKLREIGLKDSHSSPKSAKQKGRKVVVDCMDGFSIGTIGVDNGNIKPI